MQLLPHSGSTKFPEALINLYERCLQTPTVPVSNPNHHSSIQPSPAWVFKPSIPLPSLSWGFQPAAPAAVLTVRIVCYKSVHLSERCTAGKQRGLGSLSRLCLRLPRGSVQRQRQFKTGKKDWKPWGFRVGLSILDCSLWNSIEYIMEIVLGAGLRHQTYLLPPPKLLSLLNSLNLEGLLPSEST